jgi:hypothetical protein
VSELSQHIFQRWQGQALRRCASNRYTADRSIVANQNLPIGRSTYVTLKAVAAMLQTKLERG